MSQPFKLFRLQQLDSQIDSAQARLKEIHTALNDDHALKQAEALAQQSAGTLEASRKALLRAEGEVKAQWLKIEQNESTLYGGKIRNPKELQDLQAEVAALKRYMEKLEERQLEEMIALEEAQAQHQAVSIELEKVRARSAMLNENLLNERKGLLAEVDRLQSERQATVASVLEADLNLYMQLRQTRRGIAVAQVVDKNCSACGSTLNATLLHAAHSPNQLTRCDTCGRILYSG
jgi:predicted  nucleic acid-binding Zn-ribbon protein